MRLGDRLAQCKGWRGSGEAGEGTRASSRGERSANVTLTPTLTLSETKGKGSGEGTEISLDLHFSQVPPVRVQLFDQTELPPPA